MLAVAVMLVFAPAVQAGHSSGERVQRQGSELVYQSGHQPASLRMKVGPTHIDGLGGCPFEGDCSLEGITAIRIRVDDGANDMEVHFQSDVPVFIDGANGDDELDINISPFLYGGDPERGQVTFSGGGGNDQVDGSARAVHVDGGDGDDKVLDVTARDALTARGGPGNDIIRAAGPGGESAGHSFEGAPGPGPWLLDGGEGNDEVAGAIGGDGRLSVAGGDGDDQVGATGPSSTVSCGPGADKLLEAPGTVGDGCAPRLLVPKELSLAGTFSPAKRKIKVGLGRMSRGGARVKVDFFDVPRSGRIPRKAVAAGVTLRPQAGKLTVKRRMTSYGVKYFAAKGRKARIGTMVSIIEPATGDRSSVSHGSTLRRR